jgi:hypothetical protein
MRAMTGEPVEPITPMTDEEAELFRFLRFGRLPDRVRPDELVPLTEAEPDRGSAEPGFDPYGWDRKY